MVTALMETVAVARRLGVPFGVPGELNPLWSDQLIHLFISDVGALRAGLTDALARRRAQLSCKM